MQFLRGTEQKNLINVPSEIRACTLEKHGGMLIQEVRVDNNLWAKMEGPLRFSAFFVRKTL